MKAGNVTNAVIGMTKKSGLPMVSLVLNVGGQVAYENIVFSATPNPSENERTHKRPMRDVFADKLIRAIDRISVADAGPVDGAFDEFITNGYHKRVRELIGRAIQCELEEEAQADGRVRYEVKNLTFSALIDDSDGFDAAVKAATETAKASTRRHR